MNTPQEVFDAMPDRFLPDKAKNVNVVIQFDLSGDNGGQWYLTVADGTCSVAEGEAEKAKVKIKMADSDYVAMTTGKANPVQLFMAGKVQLQGDMMLAQAMMAWFQM